MIVVLAVAIITVVGCSRSSEDQIPLATVFAGWYVGAASGASIPTSPAMPSRRSPARSIADEEAFMPASYHTRS